MMFGCAIAFCTFWCISLATDEQSFTDAQRKITCPTPAITNYATIEGKYHFMDAVVTYKCNERFYLKGSNKRKCLSNSKWSNDAPVCIPQCDVLDPVSNGTISYTDPETRLLNSQVLIICNDGFMSHGGEKGICGTDGRWIGATATCGTEPKEIPKVHRKATCGELRRISDSKPIVYSSASRIEGSNANYVCNIGFQIIGSSQRHCDTYGHWDGSDPFCKMLTTTMDPKELAMRSTTTTPLPKPTKMVKIVRVIVAKVTKPPTTTAPKMNITTTQGTRHSMNCVCTVF